MSKRRHRTGEKQVVYSGGASVCMPWHTDLEKAQVAFPSILAQEPKELCIAIHRGSFELGRALIWLDEQASLHPKTKFIIHESTHSTAQRMNEAIQLATGKYLILQLPGIAHVGLATIGIMILNCAWSTKTGQHVAVARVLMSTRLYIASLPPHNSQARHRLLTHLTGKTWSHMDVGTRPYHLSPAFKEFLVCVGDERPIPYVWLMTMKRSLWEKIGGFKTNFLYPCAEQEFAMNLLSRGVKIHGLAHTVALYAGV